MVSVVGNGGGGGGTMKFALRRTISAQNLREFKLTTLTKNNNNHGGVIMDDDTPESTAKVVAHVLEDDDDDHDDRPSLAEAADPVVAAAPAATKPYCKPLNVKSANETANDEMNVVVFQQDGLVCGGHTSDNGFSRRQLASLLARTLMKAFNLDSLADQQSSSNNHNSDKNQNYLMFQSRHCPTVSIGGYVERLARITNISAEALMLGAAHLARFRHQVPDFPINILTAHRLLLTAFLCAAKFFDDLFSNNATYAEAGGISAAELNQLEVEYLYLIRFKLFVSDAEYASLYRQMLFINPLSPLSPKGPMIKLLTPSKSMPRKAPSEPIYLTPARPLKFPKLYHHKHKEPETRERKEDPDDDSVGGRSLMEENGPLAQDHHYPMMMVMNDDAPNPNVFFPCILKWAADTRTDITSITPKGAPPFALPSTTTATAAASTMMTATTTTTTTATITPHGVLRTHLRTKLLHGITAKASVMTTTAVTTSVPEATNEESFKKSEKHEESSSMSCCFP